MAVAMFMEWDGVTGEQYDALRRLVNWEQDLPVGGVVHVAAVTERGVRVADVWDSAEAFQAFVDERLMPGVQELGIPGEPRVEIHPLHELFAPGLTRA